MFDRLADRLDVSTPVAILIIVLVIAQAILQIGSLIHLVTRPDGSVKPNRWVWAIIILFGNTVGAIVYLVVAATTEPPAVDPLLTQAEQSGSAPTGAQRAVDLLYGEQKPDQR